ncbi:MAG: oligosaccharide flippase family protein [Chloroflexota bacterium]
MTSDLPESGRPSWTKGIIGRFVHLLSAQVVDGVLSGIFLVLYLPRLGTAVYGEVMYAMAAGAIVMKVVQFGLYYPLVSDLGGGGKDKAPEILSRVNVIKTLLATASAAAVGGMTLFGGFSQQMGLVLFLISLGFALEGLADTFFADLRVRGRQDQEARIKIISAAASYGYGLIAAVAGLNPVVVSLFKLVSAAVRIWFGVAAYISYYSCGLWKSPQWPAVWRVFRAAVIFALIDILGIIYNKTNIFFLESATGVEGVAWYSATWNILDPVSTLASEQFLGWVIFPLLASLWWSNSELVRRLVRRNAQWLMAMALPIMFFLYAEADLLIGVIYPAEYKDAAWMQQYLVWTILLSFESNLFCYVMMVAGAANMLLVFASITTILNLVFNVALVQHLGLAGGCLVIILTKLMMTVLTFTYCQWRFHFFRWGDFLFPIALGAVSVALFTAIRQVTILHLAVTVALVFYLLVLWKVGPRFLGSFSSKIEAPPGNEPGV